ncbi:MAG: hypothetical protein Q7T61_01060 [Caulobacter sp.]|nr:hypothetical protein [Caulobacter sp.]
MNVRVPFNPPRLADAWPKVEQSIEQREETQAIEAYLQTIDAKQPSKRPDRRKGWSE